MNKCLIYLIDSLNNHYKKNKKKIKFKYYNSKLIIDILKILLNEGYIYTYYLDKEQSNMFVHIWLKYDLMGLPVLNSIQKISKPSKKIYITHKQLMSLQKKEKYQTLYILSTNKGIITNKNATFHKIGGKLLFKIT